MAYDYGTNRKDQRESPAYWGDDHAGRQAYESSKKPCRSCGKMIPPDTDRCPSCGMYHGDPHKPGYEQ